MWEMGCEGGVSDGKRNMGGHMAPASVEATCHRAGGTLDKIGGT